MKKLMLALVLVPSLGLAAEEAASTSPQPDAMGSWVPPKVKNAAKDKQEIQALMRAMEAASKAGDLEAAAALVDFPVTMITDDKKGQATGEAWDRAKWTEVMKPFYGKPMKDMKVTHKPEIFLLSDSLATVDDVATMTMGGKSLVSRSSMFLVRRDGQWRVKTMAEGGWGDMMASPQGAARGSTEPASEGTGSGAAATPGAQAPGTGAHEEPTERTTK